MKIVGILKMHSVKSLTSDGVLYAKCIATYNGLTFEEHVRVDEENIREVLGY